MVMEREETRLRLQAHEGMVRVFADSNNAMIEYSKMALRGSFILNGAGIIPILAAKSELLYCCISFFATGAACSVAAACISYLSQWAIVKTWEPALIPAPNNEAEAAASQKVVRQAKTAAFWSPFLRAASCILVAASLAFFAQGLYTAHSKIRDKQKEQSVQQERIQKQADPQTNRICVK